MNNSSSSQQTHEDVQLTENQATDFKNWLIRVDRKGRFGKETDYPESLYESLQKVPNNIVNGGRLRTIFRFILEDLCDGDEVIEEILSKESVTLTPTEAFVKDIADLLFDWHYPLEILYIDLPLSINVLAKMLFSIITCNKCSNLKQEFDARNRIKKIFQNNKKVNEMIQNSFDAELWRKIEDSKKIGLSDLSRFLQKDWPKSDKPLSLGRVVMLNFETFKNENRSKEPKRTQFELFKEKDRHYCCCISYGCKDGAPDEIVNLGKHKNGRTLCRILLEDVVNGHKIVLKMLDNLVVPVFDNQESNNDGRDPQCNEQIDFNMKDVCIKVNLSQISGDDYPLQVVRDLMDIQSVRGSNDQLSEIFKHPVIQILILTVWKNYIWKHGLRARFVALFVICFTAFVRLKINEYRHIDDCVSNDTHHEVYDWATCYESSFRDYKPHDHTDDDKNVDFYIKHYGLHDSIFSCSSISLYVAHGVLILLFLWQLFGVSWSIIRWRFYDSTSNMVRSWKTKLLIQIFNLVTLSSLVFLCSNRCRLMLGIAFLWGVLVTRGCIKVFVMVILPVLAGKGGWASFVKEMAKKSFWSDPENYLELMCCISVPFALFHDITGNKESVEINRGLVAAGVCCAWLHLIFILGLPSTSTIGDFITMFYNVIKIKLWFYMKVFFLLVIGFGFSFWFLNESQNGNTCFNTNIKNIGQNVCKENNIENNELCGQNNTIFICRQTETLVQPQMKALECSKSNNTVCFYSKTATASLSRSQRESDIQMNVHFIMDDWKSEKDIDNDKGDVHESEIQASTSSPLVHKSVHFIIDDWKSKEDIDNDTGDVHESEIQASTSSPLVHKSVHFIIDDWKNKEDIDNDTGDANEEDSNYMFQSIDNFAIFKNTCPTVNYPQKMTYLDVYVCPEEDKMTFNGFWKSTLMTITLSIGEFNISDFTKLFNGHETTQIFAMVFLIMLITLASISMINLLIGAIISDYKQMKEDAAKQNLMFMAEYIIFCQQAGKICEDVHGFARRRLIKKPYVGRLVKILDYLFGFIKRIFNMEDGGERVYCPHKMCHTKQRKKHMRKDCCGKFTCQEKSRVKNCLGQSLQSVQSKRYTYEVPRTGDNADKTQILDKLIVLAANNHRRKNADRG